MMPTLLSLNTLLSPVVSALEEELVWHVRMNVKQ